MSATDLFKLGKLQDAIDTQVQAVKTHPGEPGERVFLFELLVFAGDLDRARRHLDAVSAQGDTEREATAETYRRLLDAEQARRSLFSDGRRPQLLGDTPAHLEFRLQAVEHIRQKRWTDAAEVLDQANEHCSRPGRLNGKSFQSIRDCDDLFGTTFEVLANGNYFWVPYEHVLSLATRPPRFPRDLIWCPATLTLRNGHSVQAFVPALYPGSHLVADELIKLGRKTDWQGEADGPALGMGLRMLASGEDDVPIVDVRELEFDE